MTDRNTHVLLILIVFSAALLTLQELLVSIAITAAVVLAAVGQARGWWLWLARSAWLGWLRLLNWLRRPAAVEVERPLYEMRLGYDPETRRPDVETLPDLGHIGVYGTRRFGKTTLLHSFIHDLITHYPPSKLRLLIIDPKKFDYSFYSGLPHLLKPIARDKEETAVLIKYLQDEMSYRGSLFEPYAKVDVCNDLERYEKLSGQSLPLILVVFDEVAEVIDPGSKLETDLVRLAKICGGVGIQFIFATQRPSSGVITGELKSQVASRFITWMATNREYGVVAEIPKEMYEAMPRMKGRYIVYTEKGWRFMQSYKVPDSQLIKVARRYSGRPRVWPEPERRAAASPPAWSGDDDEKAQLFIQYERELGKRPSLSQLTERFGITKPTARKYRDLAWG